MNYPVLSGILIWTAVAMALICSVGLLAMHDVFQRIHFSAVLVGVCVPLMTLALWIETDQWQVRLKTAVIAIVLFTMNGILTQATARAFRIRQSRHLEPQPGDGVEVHQER